MPTITTYHWKQAVSLLLKISSKLSATVMTMSLILSLSRSSAHTIQSALFTPTSSLNTATMSL